MGRWRVWKSDGIWRAQKYGSKKVGYAGGMSNALWLVSTVEKGKNLDLLISGTKLELPPTHCPKCQRPTRWERELPVKMHGAVIPNASAHICMHCGYGEGSMPSFVDVLPAEEQSIGIYSVAEPTG